LNSLRTQYDCCVTCHLPFMNPNNDMWCHDCQNTVCPSCMLNSHVGHQLRKAYNEAEVMLEHAASLLSVCDRISCLKPCFDANVRRERSWLSFAKHKIVGTWWAYRPFSTNFVAHNERRVLSVIWKFPHRPLSHVVVNFCFLILMMALSLKLFYKPSVEGLEFVRKYFNEMIDAQLNALLSDNLRNNEDL